MRNCKQGVKFNAYQNFNPNNGNPFRNFSVFEDCEFYVDQDFPVAYDFQEHVNLWRVDGIRFNACTFENRLPDAFFDDLGAYPGSTNLGYRIYSLDANYRVNYGCDVVVGQGQPCPSPRVSSFSGLDHGIHALQSQTHRNFSVDHANFSKNICGVYAEGVVGYKVVNSNFSLGDRNVTLTNPSESNWQGHRGIFSTESYGMIVEDNTLVQAGTLPTEGIVIGYSRGHNDIIFRNNTSDLGKGYVGEGICIQTGEMTNSNIGLQFLCNGNTMNEYDIMARIATNSNPAEWDEHAIRTLQGDADRPARNTFDRNQGLPPESDFKNGTDWAIDYNYDQPNSAFEPIDVTSALVTDQCRPTDEDGVIADIRVGIADDEDGRSKDRHLKRPRSLRPTRTCWKAWDVAYDEVVMVSLQHGRKKHGHCATIC